VNEKIIQLKELAQERQEKIRDEALKKFPWHEIELYHQEMVEPLARYLSINKRIMLLEMVYRLGFEAFYLGMLERKSAYALKKRIKEEIDWEDIYIHHYRKEGDRLIQSILNSFSLFQWLDEWYAQSVLLVFEDLTRRWFIEGVTRHK
jgi:hypothetical protein